METGEEKQKTNSFIFYFCAFYNYFCCFLNIILYILYLKILEDDFVFV